MIHEERIEILQRLCDGLERNETALMPTAVRAPVADLTCREQAAREQQVFFREAPLLMGLSTDLPGADSYVATTETGVPVLMTRDADGTFRAFFNVCRHRGVQVVPDGRGTGARFTCPFHAWSYRNTGELIAVNREARFGTVDRAERSLVELPVAERHGMLWVRPSPGEAFDVDEVLGGLAPQMAAWDLPSHPFREAQVIDAEINWKLAIDTFGENYHFDVLHRDTLAPDIHGNLQTHDVYGDHYRMVFANKPGFARVREEGLPIEQWPFRWITLCVYFFYPNVILLVDPGGVDILRMYPDPDDPGRSRTYHSYYMNPQLQEHMQREGSNEQPESRFVGFNRIVVEEDYAMAASAQRAASSGAQTHYLFGRNEPALHHYHNAHRRGLGLPQLEPA